MQPDGFRLIGDSGAYNAKVLIKRKDICMKKPIAALLLLLLCLSFASCGEQAPENRVLTHGWQVFLYKDTVYYSDVKRDTAVYQNLNHIQPKGLLLVGDSLDSGSDDPLKGSGLALMVVSEYETEKNGGYPVLYICVDASTYDKESETRLVSFNTKTNASKDICVLNSRIFGLYAYGEYIIFDTSDGDRGYNLHIVKCDGSGHKTLENPDSYAFRAVGAYNDEVYYYSGATLYKVSLDLTDPTFVLEGMDFTRRFFYNNCLYCKDRTTGKLVCCSLSGEKTQSIISDDGVMDVAASGNKVIYRKTSELYVDGVEHYIFYMMDLNTLEEREILRLDIENYTYWGMQCFDGERFLFITRDLENTREYCVINIETGEKAFMDSGW